ncbi:uncharacterized protein LOC108199467 isoform X2 [Daucus carota subsp. sativus]|uniref:uncharacterized protein LOC108199467 isoform X2 n=1 Tax=Daucus carota subsp. sativus TaxID=79200 RepID=UPI0030826D6C
MLANTPQRIFRSEVSQGCYDIYWLHPCLLLTLERITFCLVYILVDDLYHRYNKPHQTDFVVAALHIRLSDVEFSGDDISSQIGVTCTSLSCRKWKLHSTTNTNNFPLVDEERKA